MTDKKTDAMAPTKPGSLAVPDELAGIVTTQRPTGGEAAPEDRPVIAREDSAMPRLSIAQKTSKQIEDGHPSRINGLKFTEMYHSGDGRMYGNGPVHFCVLRVERPRYVQWRPMEEGGGIIDPNVPPGDPRTKFTEGPNGTSVKPLAMKYLDFIVLVLNGLDMSDPLKNVMAISCKSKVLASAKQLNNLIGFRSNKKLYLGVYRATTERADAPKGAYGTYVFANSGWLTEGTPVEQAAAEMWEGLKGREVEIEREEPQPNDPDDFDPEQLERESQAARNAHTDM